MSVGLHKTMYGIIVLPIAIAILLITRRSAVKRGDERFDFEFYEHLKVDQAKTAREFLLQKYPVGSDAKAALKYVELGGAKCVFAHDKESHYYFCQYIRAGRGLMMLITSIEWKVIIITNEDGSKIMNFSVGREVSGL